MLKTLTLAAVAVIAITAFDVVPANARGQGGAFNGIWENGATFQGTPYNGNWSNGYIWNGTGPQGISYNGGNTALDGRVVDIEFPAPAATHK